MAMIDIVAGSFRLGPASYSDSVLKPLTKGKPSRSISLKKIKAIDLVSIGVLREFGLNPYQNDFKNILNKAFKTELEYSNLNPAKKKPFVAVFSDNTYLVGLSNLDVYRSILVDIGVIKHKRPRGFNENRF